MQKRNKGGTVVHVSLYVKQQYQLIEIAKYITKSYIVQFGNESASFLLVYGYFYAALVSFASVLKFFYNSCCWLDVLNRNREWDVEADNWILT